MPPTEARKSLIFGEFPAAGRLGRGEIPAGCEIFLMT
jgi:hypothetical protein